HWSISPPSSPTTDCRRLHPPRFASCSEPLRTDTCDVMRHSICSFSRRITKQYQHFQLVFEAEAELRDIVLAHESASTTMPWRSRRRESTGVGASDDVTPNPSAVSIALDSVSPGIRRVVDSLESMAADSELVMSGVQ